MNDCCEMNDGDLDNVSGGDPMARSNCGIPGYNYCVFKGEGGLYAGECPKTLGNVLMDMMNRVNSPDKPK